MGIEDVAGPQVVPCAVFPNTESLEILPQTDGFDHSDRREGGVLQLELTVIYTPLAVTSVPFLANDTGSGSGMGGHPERERNRVGAADHTVPVAPPGRPEDRTVECG
ncbi:MAG: hypothetical protein KF869_15315 [Phycisphaeraceae bacterium]|nr:hypothetical protein [Phycisphaeraceae bacterium]